jgi:hypothetical protein
MWSSSALMPLFFICFGSRYCFAMAIFSSSV